MFTYPPPPPLKVRLDRRHGDRDNPPHQQGSRQPRDAGEKKQQAVGKVSNQAAVAPEEEYECSMGAESLEAEQRGYQFLHELAFSHRKDALEISNKNKPPDGPPPKAVRK